MRQVLFYIPLTGPWHLGPLGDVPGFGFGIVLAMWLIFSGVALRREWLSRRKLDAELWQSIAYFAAFAVGIVLTPNLAPIERVPVYGYGAMLVVGALLSGLTAATRCRLAGAEPQFAWDMAVKLVLTGVIGSRLFYLIQYRERVYAQCQTLFDYVIATINLTEGGLVLYGGLILGTATYFVLCRRHGISPVKFGDAVVPAVFVGEACGRVGCLLNGCCYGDPCELAWGLQFPQGSVPWMSLVQRGFLLESAPTTMPLHPTQIYSTINALLLAGLTTLYYRRRAGDGSVLALAIMSYAVSRGCIEILRGDELGKFGTTLTISQWVSIFVFCGGAALAAWSWRASRCQLSSGQPHEIKIPV